MRKNAPKIAIFLLQSLFRNAVNISVFAFVSLLQRKMQKLEFCWYLHGFIQVIFQNTVNTSVFEEVVQKHCQIQHFADVVFVKVTQIAVFWLRWFFLMLQKHRKYRCFGSILGLREEENIVNSVVFVFGGSRKHCKLRCFERFSKQKFSHLKGKKTS